MATKPSPQTDVDSLHRRGEDGKSGPNTDQIIAIIAIVASVFGAVILCEIVAQVKRMRLRAKKKRSDLEAGIEGLEVSGGGFSCTITNNFTGCSFHALPTLPKPIVPARHAAGPWPERGGQDNYPHPNGYFPKPGTPAVTSERHFIWQLHSDSVAVQSDFNLLGRPFLESQV